MIAKARRSALDGAGAPRAVHGQDHHHLYAGFDSETDLTCWAHRIQKWNASVCSPVSAAPHLLRACGLMSGSTDPQGGYRNRSVRFLIMRVINVMALMMGRSTSVVPEGKP